MVLPLVHYISYCEFIDNAYIIIFYFRTHKSSLKLLKKTLSASSKSRRHRRNMLNIMITLMAWGIEMFGFLLVFIGTHILGHQNQSVNLLLQTLTDFFYFLLVPSFLLINDKDMKGRLAESDWYDNFLSRINCQYIDPDKDKKEEEGSIADVNSTMEAVVEANQGTEDNNESDHIEIDNHQPCFKRRKNQIYEIDTNKIDKGTHNAHSTNGASNDCEIIDLESVN